MRRVDVVLLLLDHEPRIARHKDPYDGLLLQKALKCFSASDETIELILNAYPEAVFEKRALSGGLPLHSAAARRASPREVVVETLIKTCPSAVSVSDNYGRLPLHWACDSTFDEPSLGFMQMLINPLVTRDIFGDFLTFSPPSNNTSCKQQAHAAPMYCI